MKRPPPSPSGRSPRTRNKSEGRLQREPGPFPGSGSSFPYAEVVRVKFCGITNLDDAAEAVRLGAWAVGLIHFHGSPRDVDRGVATEIAAAFRRKAEVVGVFVNPTLEEVVRAVEDEGLTMVQLNGAEGASFCAEV